jgi:adenosyl cobinamide kinase/adenosyl cobinamide phosphate guanylyltransferase
MMKLAGKQLILITGGCRSGKSQYALDYANRHFSKKIYLATCEALDDEMIQRVETHKRLRGPEWLTIEEPVEIADQIKQYADNAEVILLDCLTLWLSNLLLRGNNDLKIMEEMERLIHTLRERRISVIIVSNEVGMGIVPADPLSRRFRDLSGMANQKIAEEADAMVFMVSGMPILLKGKE